VLVARDDAGTICGVIMLMPAWAPNQQHHAEVSKLLVHSRARRRGHGRKLLAALVDAARANRFSLLTLDTETDSDAYRLYVTEGWTRAGAIPRFAVDGNGAWVETTYFYRFVE
jgi:ribosomal protein S18 acetylase RimI-like enzyme